MLTLSPQHPSGFSTFEYASLSQDSCPSCGDHAYFNEEMACGLCDVTLPVPIPVELSSEEKNEKSLICDESLDGYCWCCPRGEHIGCAIPSDVTNEHIVAAVIASDSNAQNEFPIYELDSLVSDEEGPADWFY